jgi:flagellar biosynthesis/type III secretory pathway chaperone
MNPVWQDIADALRSEIVEYGAMLRLFEQQQHALFARDPEAILRLNTEIESQVRAMQTCRRVRENRVAGFAESVGQPSTATLRSLLPFVVEDARPLLEALITEINVLIHRVRRLSRHNHSLLRHTFEAQQQLLRQLQPERFTQTYAPSGRVSLANAVSQPALKIAG